MITIKNNSGFTLIEVMLALAIAATILTSIYMVQSGAILGVSRYSDQFMRMMHAKNFLFTARRQREAAQSAKQFKLEKKEENPEVYLKYAFGSIEKGPLKNLKDLYIEKVEIAHDARQKEPTATLFTLVYLPEDNQ